MNLEAEYSEDIQQPKLSDKHKRGILLLSVSLFPVIITTLLFLLVVLIGNISFPDKIGTSTKFASITTPADKASILRKITIAGTISKTPENHSYYLVEHREKRYWPKYALGIKEGKWSRQLSPRAKKGVYFTYQVVMVNEEGKQEMESWFKTARETGKYPGLPEINVEQVVAKIKVKTK